MCREVAMRAALAARQDFALDTVFEMFDDLMDGGEDMNNLICAGQVSTLCGLQLETALPNVINIMLFVAFVAALVFLIYGGIRWILSGGDKEGTAKAKGTVTSALIGLAIVLGSWLLLNVVLNLFGVENFSSVPKITGP